jgi:hypothetical protein
VARRRWISGTLQLAIFIALAGCLSPYGVDVDDASGRLVITGQVSTVDHRNIVTVHRTNEPSAQATPLSGAFARIVDDLGNSWNCVEMDLGVYAAQGLTGVPGRTYHVEVAIPGTGEQYRSQPEKIPNVLGEDSVYYDFAQEEFIDSDGTPSQQLFVNFRTKVSLEQPTEAYYMKWTVNEIFLLVPTDFPDPFGVIPPPCYIRKQPDPQRVVTFDGGSRQSLSTEFLVAKRLADAKSFHSKYSAYIYRSSLTPEAHEYWRRVAVLVNQVGSIFDTPPAEIEGNIFNLDKPNEKVYGYFQASNESYHRITISSFEMPYLPVQYCEYENTKFPNQYPSECLNCLNFASSSYEEPVLFRGDN